MAGNARSWRCSLFTSRHPSLERSDMAVRQDPVVERLRAELRSSLDQVAQLRAEVDERNAEVQLLHEIATALTAAASLEEMLEFIAATAVRVTETDSAS